MELTLDKFGRILIPKEMRDQLGLHPGSTLHVEKTKTGLQLNPIEDNQGVIRKGKVLVFVGKLMGNIEEIIDQVREERNKKVWSGDE